MCLHKVNLFLQFKWVGPVIVAFAIGYIFATRSRVIEYYVHLARKTTGVLVFGFEEWEYDVRMLGSIVADDIVGAVGRSIVVNQYLNGEVSLLHQKAVEAVADKGCMVVAEATDADERRGSHDKSGLN